MSQLDSVKCCICISYLQSVVLDSHIVDGMERTSERKKERKQERKRRREREHLPLLSALHEYDKEDEDGDNNKHFIITDMVHNLHSDICMLAAATTTTPTAPTAPAQKTQNQTMMMIKWRYSFGNNIQQVIFSVVVTNTTIAKPRYGTYAHTHALVTQP